MNFLRAYTRENNLSIKTSNIKAKYICNLCHQILYRPKITKCSCSFCEECLITYLEGFELNERICPTCGHSYLNKWTIFDDKSMELRLESLQIVCPHTNCAQVMNITSIEEHVLNECDNKPHSFLESLGGTETMLLLLNDGNNDGTELNIKSGEIMGNFKGFLEEIGKINNENKMKLEKMETDMLDLRQTVVDIQDKLNQRTNQMEDLQTTFLTELTTIKEELGQLRQSQEQSNSSCLEQTLTGNEIVQITEVESRVGPNTSKVTFRKLFSGKSLGSHFWSDKFIIHNYSFRILIKYEQVILVFLYLSRGSFDHLIEWPLKRSILVNIDLNDRSCGEYLLGYSNSSCEFRKNFGRPNNRLRYWLNECDMKIEWNKDSNINDGKLDIIVKLLD